MAVTLGKRKSAFGIKISEIPIGIGEDDLRSMFTEFGNILNIVLKDSQPLNHAFINYDSPHSAADAADRMNGCGVPGGVLKVKLQSAAQLSSAKKYRTAASVANTVSVPSTMPHGNLSMGNTDQFTGSIKSRSTDMGSSVNQFSVKISNINPFTKQEELSRLFKTTVIVKDVVASSKKYAYANFKSQEEVEEAVKLNNALLDDLRIQVKRAGPLKNVSLAQSQNFVKDKYKMSATLHSYFLAKMAGYTKEFKAKGGLVIWENGYLQISAPSTEMLEQFQSRAVSCLFEDSLQLSADSWNNFVSQHPDGSSLFKQWLTHPFCSNPNVQIHLNESTFELIFVGRRVAVQDAKQTMTSEVCRVIPVDGVKLLYFLRMFPNMDKTILKDSNVKIQQLLKGSTEIAFSGNTEKFYESYIRITRIFDRQTVTTGKCFGLLIHSAQERLCLENLPAVLCAQNEDDGKLYYANAFARVEAQISVLICGPWCVPQKVQEILNSPEKEEINFPNIDVLQRVKKLPGCNFIELLHGYRVYISENVHKPSLIIQGYVRKEIMKVTSILSNAAEGFILPHPPGTVTTHTKKIQYHCHILFKSLMQKYVTMPLQNRLMVTITMILSKSDDVPEMLQYEVGSAENKNKYQNITITAEVESNNLTDCSAAYEQMKVLQPHQKHCSWSKEEYEVLSKTMKSELTDVKKYYRVHIEFDDNNNSVVIYGISVNEVLDMEEYLSNCTPFKQSVELPINITWYQSLFLQTRYRNTLKRFNCDVLFPNDSDFQFGYANMCLIGRRIIIEKAEKLIREVIDGLQVRSLKFRHERYGEMWKRKWHEVKMKMEEEENIVVSVFANLGERNTSNPADKGLTVEIVVVGNDNEVISKVENYINSIGTMFLHKTKDLEKIQLVLVLRGLKLKKLRLREDYNTEALLDWDKLTIELITPNGSSEDLEAAYSTVMTYVESVAINSEVVPIEKPSLGIFLQHNRQWQQILTIGKRHSVLVELLIDSIDIRGETTDVAIAKKLIGDKVQEISELFEEREIVVRNILLPILDTPMFEAITAKVSQDYDSILWCKIMHSIQVKQSDSTLLTIGVYSGDILNETSDAIVNVIGSNTLTVRLTEELISAGGPTIQQEYNDYVKTHGPIGFCQAICLGSGDLNCKKLIHVVPPLKVLGNKGEISGLDKAITNVLLLAEEHSINSISIPSIYNDISEWAKVSIQTTLSLCAKGSLSNLKSVRFVLPTVELAYQFKQKLIEFQNAIPATELLPSDQYLNWLWEDDFGYFKPYSPENSALLSKEFYLNAPTSTLTIEGNTYTIDFIKMVQINKQTQKSRQIIKKLQPVWKYENDQGHWDLYTEQQSQKIEAMWQAKKPHDLKIGKWAYRFNFNTTPMTQMNVLSRKKRSICRENAHCTQISNKQMSLLLVGPKPNLDKAKNDIDEFFKSNITTEEISLTSSLPASLICDISTKHSIEHSITPTQVVLKGLKSNVMKATMDIKDELFKKSTKIVMLPAEWEPQTEDIELKSISEYTSEWSKVSQLFHATLSSAKIVKIERVQSKWLWEKYSQHSERMNRKNDGDINEKMLFHGTSDTPPSSIYQDEEGFDMRYSNAGLWGIGIYFAVNASYSDKYAHSLPNGMKQMFLAKVLTGNSKELPSRRDLRLPPVKEKSLKGVVIRYDTVKGHIKGSDVYITYLNDKAYPYYLITYK